MGTVGSQIALQPILSCHKLIFQPCSLRVVESALGEEQAAEIEDSNAELPWNFTVPLPLQNAPRIQSAISMFYESVKMRVQEAGVLGFTCNGGESVAWVKHTQCPESVVL